MTRPDLKFWHGKRVLVTGHTGFKGSWMSAWLMDLGARVSGLALDPITNPNLCEILDLPFDLDCRVNLQNLSETKEAITQINPEFVFHMAAQPLVGVGYREPVETFATNIMGTAHLLEALREQIDLRAVIVVTSDKAYDNEDYVGSNVAVSPYKFTEDDRLGGKDPYSASKGGQELVTRSYAFSFFESRNIPVATVRAGNVIGGGDWSEDRLMTDILKSLTEKKPLVLRHPGSTRPWQHVLEPLAGYLLYMEALVNTRSMPRALNFGPDCSHSVSDVAETLLRQWGAPFKWQKPPLSGPNEARSLEISSEKAKTQLDWKPQLDLESCLQWIVDWHKSYVSHADMRDITRRQIQAYQQIMSG